MYYQEQVINGILHYRSSPNSDWIPMSKEKLTKKVLDLKEKINNLLAEDEENSIQAKEKKIKYENFKC